MEDNEIISLYWKRDENAIKETEKKYGKYCTSIAYNILQNKEDSKECVNDTYLKTWNSIPPQKPNILKLYLAKITRNLALNKYEKNRAHKRNNGMELVLEELEECIPNKDFVEEKIEYQNSTQYLNNFLKELQQEKRSIFLERYWYFKPIKEIARKNNLKENNVKVILFRLRNELKEYLIERGISI